MTRINAGIPVEELSDKHLLAEHREIKRIPNAVISGKAILKDIPKTFTLGKGHVKFFYNKLGYLYMRYLDIYNECCKRGFRVTDFSGAFIVEDIELRKKVWKAWEPTEEAKQLIRERIKERTNGTTGN